MQSVTPTQLVPITFSANEVLDSGSPLYCYIKVPTAITSVQQAIVSLAIRQFFATATAASSGGGTTPTSGASSASSAGNKTLSITLNPGSGSVTSGVSGAASTGTAHTHGVGTYRTLLDSDPIDAITDHNHTIAHTHDVTVPAHTHSLTYGTFEETMPVSWSVKLRIYKLIAGVWTLQYTSAAQTTLQGDIDVTSIITGPGDWRLTVLSDPATPNGGRVSCDLYGAITAQIG